MPRGNHARSVTPTMVRGSQREETRNCYSAHNFASTVSFSISERQQSRPCGQNLRVNLRVPFLRTVLPPEVRESARAMATNGDQWRDKSAHISTAKVQHPYCVRFSCSSPISTAPPIPTAPPMRPWQWQIWGRAPGACAPPPPPPPPPPFCFFIALFSSLLTCCLYVATPGLASSARNTVRCLKPNGLGTRSRSSIPSSSVYVHIDK